MTYLARLFRRQIMCRLGRHGPKFGPTGVPANCCGFCGQLWRAEAWRQWEVVLRDGSIHQVRAINEWHAGSQVVYGEGPAAAIDGRTGKAIGSVKVHRDNIASIVLVTDAASSGINPAIAGPRR